MPQDSKLPRKYLGAYLVQVRRIWNHLPSSLRDISFGRMYGRHLHALVRLHAERQQYFATFFLRNRPELELIRRLANKKPQCSNLKIAVLACSKGAEVYSIVWAIHSARPDLTLNLQAVDISQEILEFAARGEYSLTNPSVGNAPQLEPFTEKGKVTWNSHRDQLTSMFERMTRDEVETMFEVDGDRASIKPWLKEGIAWVCGDAGHPELVQSLGPQDLVVANRFLCHMPPEAAEKTLRNIGRLVKPGGYLFVSGVDLDVRSKVAREMAWQPVSDLLREVHEGDPSLERGWPLEYYGLEPFCEDRRDWKIRYASVFQIG